MNTDHNWAGKYDTSESTPGFSIFRRTARIGTGEGVCPSPIFKRRITMASTPVVTDKPVFKDGKWSNVAPGTVAPVNPAPKAAEPKKLNVYHVSYVVRTASGIAPATKVANVIAESDTAAAAHVTRHAVVHPVKKSKDAAGHEHIDSPAFASIEVTGIRTGTQDVEVAKL